MTIRKKEDLLKIIQVEDIQTTDSTVKADTRAGVYSFLAALCNQRPNLNFVRRLRALRVDGFLSLIEQEEEIEDVRSGVEQISKFITNMAIQSDEQVEQALAVDWTRLFRGLRPGYGPPPPYEGLYLGGDDLKTLQAVAHCYRDNGVEPGNTASNRPDYVGMELDFLRYTCERQAAAWKKGDVEEVQKWERVEHDFRENHLGSWIAMYCQQAVIHAQTDFYRGTLLLLAKMIGQGEAESTTHFSTNTN